MGSSLINYWKPNLFPNNSVDGSVIDWDRRLIEPREWFVSEKYDGIRIELYWDDSGICRPLTRSLKPFRSVWINDLAKTLDGIFQNIIVEGEIYCKDMMFSELQHFILSENVESVKAIKKVTREVASGKFPGRSVDWLSHYNHNFKIYVFDFYSPGSKNDVFEARLEGLHYIEAILNENTDKIKNVHQSVGRTLHEIESTYDFVLDNGGEGLILKHRNHIYKTGRNTLNEGMVFKMKDEFNWYTGKITDVLEGTVVDPDAPVTFNELGYSRTSKLQEDRWPSGMAKGFEVALPDDAGSLTVTLKGFDNIEKGKLLRNKNEWIGKTIEFLAMKPTKINGVPRQAKYIRK